MANAHSIVDTIHLVAITSLTPILEQYPILKDVLGSSQNPLKDWDFFMTAAGSGIVLMSSESFEGEHKIIHDRLIEIDKNMPKAIADFISFMNKTKVQDHELAAQIGLWVLWNIKKEEPIFEEMKELPPIIGNFLMKTVQDNKNKC